VGTRLPVPVPDGVPTPCVRCVVGEAFEFVGEQSTAARARAPFVRVGLVVKVNITCLISLQRFCEHLD